MAEALMQQIGRQHNDKGIPYASSPKHEHIWYLLQCTILHDPMEEAIMVGDPALRKQLPRSKSLFHAPEGCGLPIGNLTSQLFSNLYMNPFDQFVKRQLKIDHYGRYVDDFFLLHRDPKYLLSLLQPMKVFLQQELDLYIHPKKVRLTEVKKGVTFLGLTIKPFRRYIKQKTVKRLLHRFRNYLKICQEAGIEPEDSVVQSNLGYLKSAKTYWLREQIKEEINTIYQTINKK